MRNAKTLSITLPPEMLSRAQALARKESRTMSELIREALRQYERLRWWEETNAYGRVEPVLWGSKVRTTSSKRFMSTARNEAEAINDLHDSRRSGQQCLHLRTNLRR